MMEQRVRQLPALFLAPLLLLSMGTLHAEPDYLEVSKGIGDFLLKTARKDGEALYWAQYEGPGPEAHGEKAHFPVSFYSGVSGTGYFLLNLYHATGEKRYLEGAAGAGLRLVKTAKPLAGGAVRWESSYERKGRSVPDGGGLGLYTGNAGIGVFLLYLGEAAKDARFRKTAEASFARVLAQAKAEGEGLHWEHSSLDIIGGEAGIGLGLLAMHEKTKNPKYLAVARKAAKWLAGKAEREGKALRWKKYGAYDAGFSHGASGVAFFLHLAGDMKSARSGADWVASVSRPRGKGAILWEYYAGEPPKGKSNWIMNSWCHGAPGTVRIFTLLHRRGGGKADLETAIKGGGGIRFELRMDAGKPRYFNPTYCCGASGCIDAFLDLYQASGEKRWLDDAKRLADDVLGSFRDEAGLRVYAEYNGKDRAEKKNPYFASGFMLGNPGIGHVFLRLALLIRGEEDKLVFFPDHPFAWR